MRRYADPTLYIHGADRGGGRRRPRLRVRALMGAYLLALAGNFLCLIASPTLTVIAYPLTGVILSRYIGRRIRWLREHASIRNVAMAKRTLILGWPAQIPTLAVQLFTVRYF